MKAKILFTILAAMVFNSTATYAQKVEQKNGAIIIDASAIVHATEPKANSTTATATDEGPNDATNIASQVTNAKVAKRFEVSKEEDILLTHMEWLPAIDYCKAKGWRLPTQRELMLMYVLRADLEQWAGVTKFADEVYWGATENGGISAWQLFFGNGRVYMGSKDATFRVRCIREVI